MEKKFIYADLFMGFQDKLSELIAALRVMHKCEKVTEVERRAVHTKRVELLGLYNDMLTEVQILKGHGTE